MILNVIPLVGVGSVRFGMSRRQVRAIWGDASEFQKTPDSIAATDDYGFCHVYYDEKDCCEAIEVFDDAEVLIDGRKLFPLDADELLERFPEFEADDDGPICCRWAAAVYAPYGTAESILFGKEGYFE